MDSIFKMAAIDISEIICSAITQFLESIETRFWCLNHVVVDEESNDDTEKFLWLLVN